MSTGLSWVAAQPSGSLLALALDDGRVVLWRRREGGIAGLIRRDTGAYRLAWTPDGRQLVVGWGDGRLGFYDEAGSLLHELDAGHKFMPALAVSPDGKRVATGGDDATTRVFDVESKALLKELLGQPGYGTTGMAFAGDILVTADRGGYFRAYDPSWAFVAQGGLFQAPVYAVAARQGGDLVLFGADKGSVIAVRTRPDWRTVEIWRDPPKPLAVNALAFSPDGQRFVSACSDDSARIYDWSTRSMDSTLGTAFYLQTPKPAWDAQMIVAGACFDPDGEIIYTVRRDGRFEAWNPRRSTTSPVASVTFGDADQFRVRDHAGVEAEGSDGAAIWSRATNLAPPG